MKDSMFWNRKPTKEGEMKLPGPKEVPEWAGRYMIVQEKKDPDWGWNLKGVVRPASKIKEFYCHVFDNSEAIAKNVQVKDYTSLDECPDLIIYEGWFEEGAKQVKLEEKKKVNWDTPIFT